MGPRRELFKIIDELDEDDVWLEPGGKWRCCDKNELPMLAIRSSVARLLRLAPNEYQAVAMSSSSCRRLFFSFSLSLVSCLICLSLSASWFLSSCSCSSLLFVWLFLRGSSDLMTFKWVIQDFLNAFCCSKYGLDFFLFVFFLLF